MTGLALIIVFATLLMIYGGAIIAKILMISLSLVFGIFAILISISLITFALIVMLLVFVTILFSALLSLVFNFLIF